MAGRTCSSLFDPENQYQQMKREEVLRKSRLIMLDSGSSPKAGWAILDKDNAGQIGLNELSTMASQALGVPYLLLVRLVEVLDAKGTGTISKDDWLSALGDKETVTSTNLAGERPNKLMALFNPAAHPLPNAGVPLNILPYISLKVVAHTAFTGVWNSQGSDCRAHASIWAPDQLRDGVFRMKALRVSVGHYANQGFLDARGGDRYGVSKRQILQVKDISMVGLPDEHLIDFANYYLPNPAMFREVWNQLSGQQHLHIWRPVPPNDNFVALGMVATTSAEQPSVESVRCVPKSWCRPAAKAPRHIWDDAGSGGREGSIWVVNSLEVLWVTKGHREPRDDTFWELAQDSVTFSWHGKPSVNRL